MSDGAGALIVHVLAPAAFGGLERVVRQLARGQARRGRRVRVVAMVGSGVREHPVVAELQRDGLDVNALALGPAGYYGEFRSLQALCRQHGPGIVHTHGYHADLVAGTAARHLRLPTVTTVHGFTGGEWKNRLYEWLQIRALRRFDAVVVVSRPLVSHLTQRGVAAGKIHLVPNAWSRDRAPLDRATARARLGLDEERVVGWVGRLTPEKGADVLVEALARVPDRSVVACVIGDGPERAKLEALAAERGVAGRVRWAGSRLDAPELYAAFDVFVLSSRTEGTPMVLFEAMAQETPVVAAAVGGVPDVLSPAEAILVPPGDPEALAAGIRRALLERDEAAARAGAGLRRLADRYALEPWLARYDAVYEITERRGSG